MSSLVRSKQSKFIRTKRDQTGDEWAVVRDARHNVV